MSWRLLLGGLGVWVLAGCEGPQRVLGPEGPGARELAELFWTMLVATVVPTLLTFLLLGLALRRARRPEQQVRPPHSSEYTFVLGVGGVAVAAILFFILVITLRTGAATSRPPREPAVTVRIIGHQFWWEVLYPEHQVTDANELYIPAGQPVRLEIESADVIHSFWVPQLHGKIDMIPGRRHHFWLQADRTGVFRGQCAEFCGIQHALMAFYVEAEPPEAFAARMARWREAAGRETGEEGATPGERVFVEAGCRLCHGVGGRGRTGATGTAGPDLTHLASRRTLAAGTLPNTRDSLREWILRPQEIKPGSRMPPTPLPPERLEALLDYLETLD